MLKILRCKLLYRNTTKFYNLYRISYNKKRFYIIIDITQKDLFEELFIMDNPRINAICYSQHYDKKIRLLCKWMLSANEIKFENTYNSNSYTNTIYSYYEENECRNIFNLGCVTWME